MAYPNIGDILIPSEFIVPSPLVSAQPQMSGALFMSGTKLYFWAGAAKLITSA